MIHFMQVVEFFHFIILSNWLSIRVGGGVGAREKVFWRGGCYCVATGSSIAGHAFRVDF